ncbi:MAG: DUF885 family protein [Actinomycetota bacterium]|nr:DUF885 family protein [Actinomycetota bacterium]MDQ3717393.1 DUF885 family protein [Actinomycetota bacterium]
MDLITEYLLLGLRFDRLEAGFVDAYTGDPALRAQVENEAAPHPAQLRARARELLAELDASGLDPVRVDFLRAQLTGLECSATVMSAEPVGFVEEVAAYFDVHIQLGDETRYEAAHSELDALLPGNGALAQRYADYRQADECPRDRLEEVVLAMSSRLRDHVRATYVLPPGETVSYDVVTDKPWSGFNYYRGEFHSDVAINADLPHRLTQLPHLVAHESYPGHHTEHCRKEAGLVVRDQHREHTIFLVNTPECLMAEGLADLGVKVTVGEGWGAWTEEILRDLGLAADGELAQRVAKAAAPLNDVRQDAAIMLHDKHSDQEKVTDYLQRWSLASRERAQQSLRFLTDPLWRAYTSTYVEGHRLLSRWLDARPDGEPVESRFGRLLDEPLTPGRIGAELPR